MTSLSIPAIFTLSIIKSLGLMETSELMTAGPASAFLAAFFGADFFLGAFFAPSSAAFRYRAATATAEMRAGMLEADSIADALERLRRQGLRPIEAVETAAKPKIA